jgi:hypothetical protein
MYLLVWSGELCRLFEVESRKSGDRDRDEHLENFTAACWAAQRVLANVPTYMLFDDHDVTDDWNIDSGFREDTDNPTGRRVLANAIAAYWGFQGWGNDPRDRRFDTKYLRTVEDHVDGMIATNGLSHTREAGESSGAFAKQFLRQRDFGFVAPTAPKALFVDTRTQRRYERGDRAPILLDHDALMSIGNRLEREFSYGSDVIAVLPCPVIPTTVSLWGHQWVLEDGTRELAIEWDAEQFWNSPTGPFELIDMIATRCQPKHCFLLSGDVHHGYVTRAVFTRFDDNKAYRGFYKTAGLLWVMANAPFPAIEKELGMKADCKLAAIQITSSPIKNYQDKFEHWYVRMLQKEGLDDPDYSSQYSVGEHVVGRPRTIFLGAFGADSGYLQFQLETELTDEKGTRPYRAMDRAIGAPHFCYFHRSNPANGDLSEAVIRYIGLRRSPKRRDEMWSTYCKVNLNEFASTR